jgi:hypothetical protein
LRYERVEDGMEPAMTQNPKLPPPSLEHDGRTPLSRLRYRDIEVKTWRMVAAVVVVLAMLALMGFTLLQLSAKR